MRSGNLPIYKKETRIQPNIYQLYSYMDFWVMSSATSKEPVFDNVILEFVNIDIAHGTGGSLPPKTIDIWPLINLQRVFSGSRADMQQPVEVSGSPSRAGGTVRTSKQDQQSFVRLRMKMHSNSTWTPR